MKSTVVKLALTAVIVVGVIVRISQLGGSNEKQVTPPVEIKTVQGPQVYTLDDGSKVELAENAQIKVASGVAQRGFEHVSGLIDVQVAKAKTPFVVTTAYGNVTALGTKFKLEIVDGTAQNTKEQVKMLTVEVEEGSVEVANDKGSQILKQRQELIVQANQSPYDFTQDEKLPDGLRKRISSTIETMESGDSKAYIANYNIGYMYKLVKGEVPYDPNLFGGSEEDAKRLQGMAGAVKKPEDIPDLFAVSGGIRRAGKLYIRSVELNAAGDHAKAVFIERKSQNHITIMSPQWHYFDGDWWQIDD